MGRTGQWGHHNSPKGGRRVSAAWLASMKSVPHLTLFDPKASAPLCAQGGVLYHGIHAHSKFHSARLAADLDEALTAGSSDGWAHPVPHASQGGHTAWVDALLLRA
jgi:hypothetical protein